MADGPQNPNQAIDVMHSITATHVVLMVALAAAMIAVIWWGMVQSRRRRAAQKQVEEDFATAERHGATTTPAATADGTAAVSKDATTSATPPTVDVPPRQAPLQPVPVPQATSPQAPAPEAVAPLVHADDLTRIKGLGPKLAATLSEQGITRVEQIAALSPEAAVTLDAKLGAFQGRMTRDRWIEQARLLSAGDRAGYEAAFGKLGD